MNLNSMKGRLEGTSNSLKKAIGRVNWSMVALVAGLFLVATAAHAGPIQQGVQKGMDETTNVGKYVGAGVAGLLTLVGGGRVAYKVMHNESDWGISLGAAILGIAIGAVTLAA